ncbi:DUF302 domain-containing protein [Streptomyces sp. NPDC059568]|uniref:DUF302 domain-containing protein n=1 Tax=Streptomyces sp. NPDC059568 TaxID=3346868 RepID=UPI003698A430
MTTTPEQHTEYLTRRIDVLLPQPYDTAVRRYEELVPVIDLTRFGVLATWDAVREQAEINAPHGFMIYWKADITSDMATSPSDWKCAEYLMGNHVIAQRMYDHDPAVMLHAPLRTVLYADAEGRTHFAVDHPSSHFASYGKPEVTEVGRYLDRLLADLLALLGAEVPDLLKSTVPA